MMVREPIAGTVKTRLVPALGAIGAAELYRAFLEDLCSRLAPRVHLMLACAPDAAEHAARLARRHRVTVLPQGEGDLGARMRRVALAALTASNRVVLIGSDAPTLPLEHVSMALRALRRKRVVLGPSLDGGYYLIGFRGPPPDVFTRMPWGEASVLARTLARLRRARITPAVLPAWYDVDVAADVDLLTRHLAMLATLGSDPAPRTRRLLARLAAQRTSQRASASRRSAALR
jgi:rSAM/selenodomain-associated transferase 1